MRCVGTHNESVPGGPAAAGESTSMSDTTAARRAPAAPAAYGDGGDFALWAQQQAALIRRAVAGESALVR